MRLVTFFIGVALTVACSGASPTSPTPAAVITAPAQSANPNVVGVWTGTMRSQSGTTRAIRLTLVGAYNTSSYSLGGTWAFVNTNEGADVIGLVQSNPFSIRINASTSSPTWCSYNVTLSVSGNTANGDYATSVCSGRATETGSITLAK